MDRLSNDQLLRLASETLEAALHHLRQRLIPSTPENIMVWYHYVEEISPQLNRDIDLLIDRGTPFTAKINIDLYQRYFTEMDGRKLELVRAAMRELLYNLNENIHHLTEGMEEFEEVLVRSQESLKLAQDSVSIQHLIELLLQESRSARETSQRSRQKIDLLTEEVTQLKSSMDELERSALEDALTSIANRRAFDQVFSDFLKVAGTTNRNCCLLMIDIDRFKSFNDKYGHQAGDKVLRFVAMILKKMVKGQDFVARYGGEEFAILLPSTTYSGGLSLAQAIVERIGTTTLKVGASDRVIDPVTISIGVSYSRTNDTPEAMFKRADVSLYEAKSRGRNTVVGERELS